MLAYNSHWKLNWDNQYHLFICHGNTNYLYRIHVARIVHFIICLQLPIERLYLSISMSMLANAIKVKCNMLWHSIWTNKRLKDSHGCKISNQKLQCHNADRNQGSATMDEKPGKKSESARIPGNANKKKLNNEKS